MAIETFDDGTVLITGDDFKRYMMGNRKCVIAPLCELCIHDGDDEYCYEEDSECSMKDFERSCSCHINAPCGKCENSHFEESPYIIHYKDFIRGGQGKWAWACFKSDKETFEAYKKLEERGLKLTKEILTTGYASVCVEAPADDVQIELCSPVDYKKAFSKIIMAEANNPTAMYQE